MRKRKATIERLLSRLQRNKDCWDWTGAVTNGGYGQITGYVNNIKKNLITHRVVYEYFNGSIPKGLTIDHLCRNRLCQNPDHLEAVTQKVNTARGISVTAINTSKTHCTNGHPYYGANLLMDKKRNIRMCKACRKEVHYNWRLKRGVVNG